MHKPHDPAFSSANYYQVLGIKSSSSVEEIRRAYRVLARRYHPDVNPGKSQAEEKFKQISLAYAVLSDDTQRRQYDAQLESQSYFRPASGSESRTTETTGRKQQAHQRYTQQAYRTAQANKKVTQSKKRSPSIKPFSSLIDLKAKAVRILEQILNKMKPNGSKKGSGRHVSVIEVTITIKDALFGVKKTVEIQDGDAFRKISVHLPPGIQEGSVVPLKDKKIKNEDILVIVRISKHPFLSVQRRGLVYEVPITLQEAIRGSQGVVAGVDEPISFKIPPGTSSGDEIRIIGKGSFLKDGSRGDLFLKLMITLPESIDAVGLKEIGDSLGGYYSANPRNRLPKELF